MNGKQINEIFDTIYYEKLSLILSKLHDWKKDKVEVFQKILLGPINQKFNNLQKSQHEFCQQTNSFLQILNNQYSFMSKLKKEDRMWQTTGINDPFFEFGKQFAIIQSNMLQMTEYLGKMFGSTASEFNEIKKYYERYKEIKFRLGLFTERREYTENQIISSICIKKSRKHFQMGKIKDLRIDIPKQIKVYNEAWKEIVHYSDQEIKKRLKMYQNIHNNLVYFEKLYKKVFNNEHGQQLKSFYAKKIEQFQKLIENQVIADKSEQDLKELKKLQDKLQQIFLQFLEQITVRKWRLQNKCKQLNKIDDLKPPPTINAFLTFDHKFLIMKPDDSQIEHEFDLSEVKICHPDENGVVSIKKKKGKDILQIQFQNSERQDQFFLHIDQINEEK